MAATGWTGSVGGGVVDATPRDISAAPERRGRILKYKADRIPIAFVASVLLVRLAIWAWATPMGAVIALIPLAVIGMLIAPINHHHQHVNSFRSPWLNRIYDIALSVQSGVGPYSWVLHHNLGHHVNYLNQRPHERPDESRWTRADGSQMGRIEYTIDLVLHHQLDIVRVGRKHRRFFRYFLWMKLPLWGLLGLGLYLKPVETLCIFVIPAFFTLCHTAWVTYEHHAGCPNTNHMDASRNNVNPWFNALTGNLGFHTAHHKRPGLHWSLLPELHAQIEDEIPEDQITAKFW